MANARNLVAPLSAESGLLVTPASASTAPRSGACKLSAPPRAIDTPRATAITAMISAATRSRSLPRKRVRFASRISSRDARATRCHEDHLSAAEFLARLLHHDLVPALRERVAHISGNARLDAKSGTAVPAEPRALDRLLRRHPEPQNVRDH